MKVPTKDLPKAIEWFEKNWKWFDEGYWKGFVNPIHESQSITIKTIQKIVIGRVPALTIWPEELKEETQNEI